MPTYVYRCSDVYCENTFEENLKYEDRDAPIDHPCQKCGGKLLRVPAMPGFAYDNVKPGKKPDNAFNDKLKEIKKHHRGSTVNVIE